MTKLALSPISICRTPIFSIHEELETVWDELKNYIHESSPDFFEVIKDFDYGMLASMEPKIRFTIWKYFNRAKFRATPYGNFAAITSIPVSMEHPSAAIIISKKPSQHRFANWQEKEHLLADPKWLSKHAHFLRTNTTAYAGSEELRYVNINNGSFELSAVENEQTTLEILNFCRTQHSPAEVIAVLENDYQLHRSIAYYFIEQLIALQLLITDFQPNIIGSDYFKRIGYIHTTSKRDYIIAERKIVKGQLPERELRVLIETVTFLNQHQEGNNNDSLKDFGAQFNRRFEGMKIPLLKAMDPELGIGYKSLAQDKEEDGLIQELKMNRQTGQVTAILDYSPLHQFILNEMIQQKTVHLQHYKASPTANQKPIANTLSLVMHYTDEYLVVDQIGGCTANALLGRFTMASEEITAMGERFASIEEEANPDILFFDIAYQLEKNTDNINRRKAIYPYELPILSWTESKQIIDLDDIMVSVNGNDIILHSLKYGKRIIPRIASAYNYTRSDLSVYRFISDIQHQHLHSALSLSIEDIFPGLVHYQRIQYKNVILSTEKWLVPKEICMETNSSAAIVKLHDWLAQIPMIRPFKTGSGDQTLIFDPSIKEDMLSFLLFCKGKTAFYIEETFIPDATLVKDEYGHSYLAEFIVNLEHKQQLYTPYPAVPDVQPVVTRTFLPGEEWLYFEIYCHPSKSNPILLNINGNFLSPFKRKFKNWFFIRYSDPSYHIRLRLQLMDIADLGEMTSAFSQVLSAAVHSGLISDLQIKTYRRETERYGASRINEVEYCFGVDSGFVMHLIKKPLNTYSRYNLSMILLEDIWLSMGLKLEEQLGFAESMADLFTAEMNITAEGFKKINLGYKGFSSTPLQLPTRIQQMKLQQTAKSFLKASKGCTEEEKSKLLSDFFHMHVNRLFVNDQRMHEMIIYYYLTKKLKMRIGREKKTT